MTKKLVSIIVPVYNVRQYLGQCLDSLLSQTYTYTEIILVNDGSTDGSGEICDKYAKKYPGKIKVIHKINEGLNYARRDGYIVSKGEIVTFVDSDDLIVDNFVAILKKQLDQHEADVSITGFFPFSDKDMPTLRGNSDVNDRFEKNIKTNIYWLIEGGAPWNDNMYLMTAWGKLYERRLIDEVDWGFSNYRANEDEFWTLQVFSKSKNGIVFTDSKLYGYRHNPQSITHKKYKNEYNGLRMDKFEFLIHLYEKTHTYLGPDFFIPLVHRLGHNVADFVDIYTDRRIMSLKNTVSAQRLVNCYASLILESQPTSRVYRKIKRMKRVTVAGYIIHRRVKEYVKKAL